MFVEFLIVSACVPAHMTRRSKSNVVDRSLNLIDVSSRCATTEQAYKTAAPTSNSTTARRSTYVNLRARHNSFRMSPEVPFSELFDRILDERRESACRVSNGHFGARRMTGEGRKHQFTDLPESAMCGHSIWRTSFSIPVI